MGDAVNIPEDKNNHILDEIRYFFAMYQGGTVEESSFNYLNKGLVDSVVGY